MINLTVVIDNDEAIRKFRELQQVAKSTTSSMVTDADRMDAAMHRFGMTMGKVGVAAALAGLVKQIAQTRGEFQQLEVAFTTLLQSKEKADALMSQMVDLAAKTPFDLQGVASGARQLLAYGFAAEDITDTLTRLGNVAAGLGLPLERLTYLYGTTAVQGRVYARDMLQFTGSGIPMLQEMAKMYGKTTEEINAMVSAGKIGFEDVRKVIENMTNEGGQFHNLMQEQSKTITGLISNLGDALDTMFNDIGKSSEGMITGVLQGTISLVENYEKIIDILVALTATYGAYKAALILTAAAQRTNMVVMREAVLQKALALKMGKELTAVQAVEAARMALVTKGWKALTVAIKANTVALLANPVTWITAAIAALAYGVYKLATAESVEEKAIRNVSDAMEKYKQKQDDLRSSAEESIRTMNDEVSTAYSKQKAYEDLIAAYPELLQKYTEEQIKMMMLTEQGKELLKILNKIRGERDKAALQTGYDEALARYRRIDSGQEGSAISYKSNLRQAEADLEKWREKLNKYKETEASSAPIEVKVASLQENINELTLQNLEIDTLIAEARKKRKDHPDLFIPYTESEEYLQKKKQSNLKTIKSDEDKITSLNSGDNKNAVKNKAYWEQQKKEATEAIEAMSDVELKTAKAAELRKRIAEAQTKIDAYSTSKNNKANKDYLKTQKELSDAILANDLALQQSRIDILAEGKEKELQQIELNNEKAVQQIEKSRQDLIAKNGGKPLSEEQEKSFTEQLENTNNATDNQRIAAELKYAKQLDDVYKQITDSSLSEIDRESRGIKEKYQELRDTVTRLLDGGSISQEKAKEWFGMINQNEIADNLEAVVNKYGSAEDKITKIQTEAAAARAKATENNRTDLIPQIDKQEQQDIGTVKADELMKTDDWINLFQNLDALSSKEIYRIIDNINAQLKNADLDPINFKAVTDQLEQAQEKAITKNPFSAIVHSFKDYKTAQEKAIGLQNKYNETQDKADKENADQASLEAIRKKQQAWQSVVSTIGEMGQALGATSDLLGQFGIESAELDGVVSAFNSIASIDVTRPFSVVTGIIGGISSLIGGIFNGKDRRAQKRIERLQDQVDALQKSYEELDRAINKAYSSDAKELIEDQNKMLQQQKILIQQQIREEQSKKKTDHDQIKQWQDQIDEINNSIEDGIAKAQDAIFGSDVQSAISDFADAYAEAWASGEDRAAASKDFVKNMIKQMIVEAMKMDIAAPMQKVRDMLETFWTDKIITPSEEEIINQMVGDIGSQLDGKYSWADKYLKNEDDSGQDASSKGFQTMSQETGEELNGRFTAIQEYTANIRDTVNSILLQGGQQLNETINIRDVAIQLNGNVAIIKGHTSHLEEMDNKLGKMVKIMNEKL